MLEGNEDDEIQQVFSSILTGEAMRSDFESVSSLGVLWMALVRVARTIDISPAADALPDFSFLGADEGRFFGAFISTFEVLMENRSSDAGLLVGCLSQVFLDRELDNNLSTESTLLQLVREYKDLFPFAYTFNRRVSRSPRSSFDGIERFFRSSRANTTNISSNTSNSSIADDDSEMDDDDTMSSSFPMESFPSIMAPSIAPLKPYGELSPEPSPDGGGLYSPHQASIVNAYYSNYEGHGNGYEEDEDSEVDHSAVYAAQAAAALRKSKGKRITRMKASKKKASTNTNINTSATSSGNSTPTRGKSVTFKDSNEVMEISAMDSPGPSPARQTAPVRPIVSQLEDDDDDIEEMVLLPASKPNPSAASANAAPVTSFRPRVPYAHSKLSDSDSSLELSDKEKDNKKESKGTAPVRRQHSVLSDDDESQDDHPPRRGPVTINTAPSTGSRNLHENHRYQDSASPMEDMEAISVLEEDGSTLSTVTMPSPAPAVPAVAPPAPAPTPVLIKPPAPAPAPAQLISIPSPSPLTVTTPTATSTAGSAVPGISTGIDTVLDKQARAAAMKKLKQSIAKRKAAEALTQQGGAPAADSNGEQEEVGEEHKDSTPASSSMPLAPSTVTAGMGAEGGGRVPKMSSALLDAIYPLSPTNAAEEVQDMPLRRMISWDSSHATHRRPDDEDDPIVVMRSLSQSQSQALLPLTPSVCPLPPLSELAQATGVIMEGHLSKQSALMKRWQGRFLVLRESDEHLCELCLYKSAVPAAWGDVPLKLKAVIPILDVAAVEAVDSKAAQGREFLLKFVPKAGPPPSKSLSSSLAFWRKSAEASGDDDDARSERSNDSAGSGNQYGPSIRQLALRAEDAETRLLWVNMLNRALRMAQEACQ